MAIQTINIGNIANDGTGDDLRVAFLKVNQNFSDLNSKIVSQVDGENLGSGQGIFYVKDNNNLQFKSLIAGNNISLTATADEITINSDDAISSIQFNADLGNFLFEGNTAVNIQGGEAITTSFSGSILTIDLETENLVLRDPAPTLSTDLNVANNNINNADTINAINYVGNVHGIDIRPLSSLIVDSDYGGIFIEATSGIELLLATANVDYGGIIGPSGLISDYGTFSDPA